MDQKKLLRLFNKCDLSQEDSYFLNYIYEEKNSLNFYYGIAFNSLSAVVMNRVLFKDSHKIKQIGFFVGYFLTLHLGVKKMTGYRFNQMVTPYYHKYGVK